MSLSYSNNDFSVAGIKKERMHRYEAPVENLLELMTMTTRSWFQRACRRTDKTPTFRLASLLDLDLMTPEYWFLDTCQ